VLCLARHGEKRDGAVMGVFDQDMGAQWYFCNQYYILGINCAYHELSAALIRDGDLSGGHGRRFSPGLSMAKPAG